MSTLISLLRPPGSTREVYSVTDRSAAAEATLLGAAPTLSANAVAAMSDPDGITALLECALELESNRLQRATTVTLSDPTGTVVGLLDPSMTTASLTTGRRNGTRRWAIADVALADDATAFEATTGDGDELPVAFGGSMLVDPVGGNHSAVAGSALGSWLTATTSYGSATLAGQVADAQAPGPAKGAWLMTTPAAGRMLVRDGSQATWYRIPANTSRTFTVVIYAVHTGTGADHDLLGHLRLDYTTSTPTGAPGAPVVLDAPPSTASTLYTGSGSYGRNVYTFTIPAGSSDVIVRSLRPAFVVDQIVGTVSELRITATQVYAGPDRGGVAALNVGVPYSGGGAPKGGATITSTWSTPRNVNRVELSGDRRAGRITAAHVETTTDGSTWTYAGRARSSGGRLAIMFASTIALGVRVTIEETTGADDYSVGEGRVWVSEVDPMLVVDVTDQVQSAELKYAREAKPGDGTIPIGNVQASTIDLELDNTSNIYSPQANATIDTGHRIECALGVRWSNLIGNPRADTDATGWVGATRTTSVPASWPYGTGLRAAVTGTGSSTSASALYAPTPSSAEIATGPGRRYRLTAWVDLATSGSASGVDVAVDLRVKDLTGAILGYVSVLDAATGATYRDTGPRRMVSAIVTIPYGTAATLAPRFTVRATTGTATLTVAAKLDEVDAAGLALTYDELVPAGVFYSDPWDAPSDSPTVTITGADRLGRFSDLALTEPVRTAATLSDVASSIALRYLDLDDDQVGISASVGAYTIPYAYPTGNVGEYLAELAKAGAGVVYVDVLDRLVIGAHTITSTTTAAELRADNALVRYRRPTGADLTCSSVKVSAAPMSADPETELWALPDGGVSVAPGSSLELVVDYTSAPAIGVYLTGVAATGAITVESAFYAEEGFLRFSNGTGATITVTAASVRGIPIVEQALAVRRTDAASRARYGAREITVDAPLVQTQAQLESIADVLLDAFRGIDSNGDRRLPDVEIDALGLIHVTIGDVVTVQDPATGLGADYQLTTRTVKFEDGAMLLLQATGRQVTTGSPFALADSSIADDVYVAGY